MNRKHIAVIFGGCSSEYSVSLESASGVISHMDPERFIPVLVGITKAGDWLHYTGSIEKIGKDTWMEADCAPAFLSPDRSRHALMVVRGDRLEEIYLDAVLPILHGKNGEDGTVQGLCELAGIPLAGCGTLASALCMDKDRAHKLVSLAGVSVPASFTLRSAQAPGAAALADKLGYPLFVKPVKAGSSYGVSKVSTPEELAGAVEEALRYDDEIILEENIPGFEVGCAIMGAEELFVGELDEIELSEGFFDFTEKYNLITSRIHVPARVPPEKTAELKQAGKTIYRALGCRGFARVDMFLRPDGEILFNEVNTIPGFTAHSRFPSMMKAAGLCFEELITRIIEMAVEK